MATMAAELKPFRGAARLALVIGIVVTAVACGGGGEQQSVDALAPPNAEARPVVGGPMPSGFDLAPERKGARALNATASAGLFRTPPMVSAGGGFSVALKSDGSVWTWGVNDVGQLGANMLEADSLLPVQVVGLSEIRSVAAGPTHAVALRSDGTVWTWGYNGLGQLGDGTRTNSRVPVQVPGLSNVVSIGVGGYHTLAVLSDGSVRAWGYNSAGQLGDSTSTDRLSPIVVPGIAGATAVAGGAQHSVALKSDGTVWGWGLTAWGQLGIPSALDKVAPFQVPGLSDVAAVAAGNQHTVALRSDGAVLTMGYNGLGQLGNGSTSDSHLPVRVGGLPVVTGVSAGANGMSTLAVETEGFLNAWGHFSELGTGSQLSSPTPVLVPVLPRISSASSGGSHAVALARDGSVWAWGAYTGVVLGNNSRVPSLSPVRVLDQSGTTFLNLGEVPPPPAATKVVFLHGFMGSRLFACEDQGTEWRATEIWPTGLEADFRKQLLPDPETKRVYVGPLIDSVYLTPLYKNFVAYMNNEFRDWEALAYDWRQSLDSIVDQGSPIWNEDRRCVNAGVSDRQSPLYDRPQSLLERAKRVLDSAGSASKLAIVTHSNGGLVAKRLIQRLESDPAYAGRVAKLIYVAVPHFGAPKAISQMMHGTDFPIPWLNTVESADLIEVSSSLPGAFQLLPSRRHFDANRLTDQSGGVVATFDATVSEVLFPPLGLLDPHAVVGSWNEFSSFARNEDPYRCKIPTSGDASFCDKAPASLDPNQLSAADETHSGANSIDNFVAPVGTKVFQIAGVGLDTVWSMRYTGRNGRLDYTRFESSFGDGTVPYESALAIPGAESYVVRLPNCNDDQFFDRNHKNILELRQLQELVRRILVDQPTDVGALGEPVTAGERCIDPIGRPVESTGPVRGIDLLRASLGSPADLHVFNASGAHTGRIAAPIAGDLFEFSEAKIPGSSFRFPHSVSAPTRGGPFLFEVRGKDTGVASLMVERAIDDVSVARVVYPNFPVTPNTVARVVLESPEDRPSLAVDANGDGIVDLVVLPTDTRPPVASVQGPPIARLGSLVTVSGWASYDPDEGPEALAYAWSMTKGPTVALVGDRSKVVTFTPTVAGQYAVDLTVNDGASASDAARLDVLVPRLGDIDLNGTVDHRDLTLILRMLGKQATSSNDLRDLNGNGTIDIQDVRRLVTLCTRVLCTVR